MTSNAVAPRMKLGPGFKHVMSVIRVCILIERDGATLDDIDRAALRECMGLIDSVVAALVMVESAGQAGRWDFHNQFSALVIDLIPEPAQADQSGRPFLEMIHRVLRALLEHSAVDPIELSAAANYFDSFHRAAMRGD